MNHFHTGRGQSGVPCSGHSTRWSGGNGANKGLIVVRIDGGGRGEACRAMKPENKP
jgi:hypothetical protein